MYEIPDNLPDITRELISIKKKPTTQERFQSYPALLQQFSNLLDQCSDEKVLRAVLDLDTGYFLPAGIRQHVIERLLSFKRSPDRLREYAMQLTLFGDVDEYGTADTNIDERVEAIYQEADQLTNL